ncbi:MAG: hypothetical protein KIT48_09340 [Pseudolabrys sp.]|nr:hypothetical protein [Pseudolabrys sp.]
MKTAKTTLFMASMMAHLTLEQIVEKARAHKVTPEEKRAQRLSLMMGLRDSKSPITREQLKQWMDEHEGR